MSKLAAQIHQCMSDLTETGENELTARFLFPAGFAGFQGHFPGRPILPAVCKIQAAVTMVEAWSRRKVRLNEIVSAKFSAPVTWDEEIVFLCSVVMKGEDRAVLKVAIAMRGTNVARFKLVVTLLNADGGC